MVKPSIEFNTQKKKRKKRKRWQRWKAFFKLMSTAVYGQTLENWNNIFEIFVMDIKTKVCNTKTIQQKFGSILQN